MLLVLSEHAEAYLPPYIERAKAASTLSLSASRPRNGATRSLASILNRARSLVERRDDVPYRKGKQKIM